MRRFRTGSEEPRIAYFISPHGFGHAARAASVMAALYELEPSVRFEIFTQVPDWFFQDSLSSVFNYHPLLTDLGLVQKTPLVEDIPETVRRLNALLPFDRSQIERLARQVRELKCALIVCDIAPMGILVAQEAGIPSVLVENFTWDWIYQGYLHEEVRLRPHIAYLQEVFEAADYRVQTEPVCCYRTADLVTPPVSRKARTPAKQIRGRLGIPASAKVVMITMGGIPEQYTFLDRLEGLKDLYFVIPGPSASWQVRNRLILLPHRSDFYHPDLVQACDVILGKLGYSTVAEVYHAGVPFGYVLRERFRESAVLAAYVKEHLQSFALTEAEFQSASWLSRLPDLLALPRIPREGPNGADQVADFLYRLLTT